MNTKEETWSYNEEITSRGNEELEKLQKVEVDDAETSKQLVEKEEKESTSPESYEKVKEEVVETFLEMTLWGEMHEELKNEKTIPTSEVDEYIIHLNNELRGTIVQLLCSCVPFLLKVLKCLLIFFKAWNLHNFFVQTPILVFLVSLESS